MNVALDRMWRKRSQPLWDVTTIAWTKEVKTRKFSVKTTDFLAKIWTRNSRMWGLMLSILTFVHETSVCLDDNYWLCHFRERLFWNWQVTCQNKWNIKLWLRSIIQGYNFCGRYRAVHKIGNISTKKFKTEGVLQSHKYNYLIGFMSALSNFLLFVSLCANASTFNQLKPSGYVFHHHEVGLTFKNSTFCPKSALMIFVWFYNKRWLFPIQH